MTSEYAYYDRYSKSKYNRIAINGKVVGCSRCVGYCKYDIHPGFLTLEMRKEHRCIEKGCNYYLPKDRYIKSDKSDSDDTLSLIETRVKEQTALFDGMRVMRVVRNNDSNYSVYYVTITNGYALENCAKGLSRMLGYVIHFERLKYDFDTCVKLIYAV